jgi:transposase-like protein
MTKVQKTTKRYSDCFKLQVVEEIENNGLTMEDCRRKYGITGGDTIHKWLRKYGKHHLLNKIVRVETREEIDELKRLRAENKALKEAYAELALHHKCSEKVIEVADELFDMDLKKSTNKSYHFTSRRRNSNVNLFILWNDSSSLL